MHSENNLVNLTQHLFFQKNIIIAYGLGTPIDHGLLSDMISVVDGLSVKLGVREKMGQTGFEGFMGLGYLLI